MKPLYLVDGYNFLHAVVLKGRDRAAWWSPDNRGRALSSISGLVAGEGVETWVVFDRRGPVAGGGEAGSLGGAPDVEAHGDLQVHHAPNADDYIVARCAELSNLRAVIVVSADRSLVDRARYHGALRLSPWAFVRADARSAVGGLARRGTPA